MGDPTAFSTEQWLALGAGVSGVLWLWRLRSQVRKQVREEIAEYLDSTPGRHQIAVVAEQVHAPQWSAFLGKIDRLADSVQELVTVTKKHDELLMEVRADLRVLKHDTD